MTVTRKQGADEVRKDLPHHASQQLLARTPGHLFRRIIEVGVAPVAVKRHHAVRDRFKNLYGLLLVARFVQRRRPSIERRAQPGYSLRQLGFELVHAWIVLSIYLYQDLFKARMLGAHLAEELLVVTARMFRAAPCWCVCVHHALHLICGVRSSIPCASVTVSPGLKRGIGNHLLNHQG